MMKRLIFVFVALLTAAGAAFAQAPDTSYVGLFTDGAHSAWRVDYGGGPAPTIFNMYIWWLPSVRGVQAAEFAISYPANVFSGSYLKNPSDLFEMGTLAGGLTIAWTECKTEWTWSHNQTCYLISDVPSQIELIEHPTLIPPEYHVATCDEAQGYPIEPVRLFTHLYCNWDGGIAVESASWGAIKSLF